MSNLPANQMRAEKLQTAFNNMSNRDQTIIFSLLLSSKSVQEKASIGLTTGAIMMLFKNTGVSTLVNKRALHEKIESIIEDFEKEERTEEVSSMYRTMRDYAPTQKGNKMWLQDLWVMNDMGFLNLLMSITTLTGLSALTVLKNDVIKCIKFAERVVVSLEERNEPDFLENFFQDYQGVKGLKGSSLMILNWDQTKTDGERLRTQKRMAEGDGCPACGMFDHNPFDC